MKSQLTQFQKIFLNLWMLLLFPCLGTIWVASCPVSFRLTSSLLTLSRSGTTAWFPLSTPSTMAPTLSYAWDTTPSPSRSGSERRSSPWAASRCARPWTPRLAAPDATADRWAQAWQLCQPPLAQVVQLLPIRYRFQTRWVLHITAEVGKNPPGNCFSTTPQGGFCMPRAGSSIAASTMVVSIAPAKTTYEDWPLTSSALLPRPALGGEPCGGCLRPWLAVKPVGNSTLYSSSLVHSVQSLFIRWYVFSNKPVLS